jgi:uncharacterized membrane protein YhaH (DUF805 family)
VDWKYWQYLLTDVDGRISRKSYWIGALTLIVVGLSLVAVGYSTGGQALAIILGLVVLYPSFALNVKRGHDRDRPTWLVALFFAILIAMAVLQLLGLVQTEDGPTTIYLAIIIIAFLFGLYLLIELGFLRGTAGPNKYGPDPLAGRG